MSILRRAFSTVARLRSPFATGPSPPRLPKEEQETFERLQRQSTGAFSTPRSDTSATDPGPPTGNRPSINQSPHNNTGSEIKAQIDARGEGQELHPDVRRGARPEFDGETNPKTGEVGGPKNEPLRWGGGGDWSYNGRVTDF